MRNIIASSATVLAGLLVAGCATSHVVPKPSKITLENALKSVGRGLSEMKEAQKDLKTGLVPSEVTVTFNIVASASKSGKLYIDLSSPLVAGVTAKAGGEIGSQLAVQRGNQITVKFTNLLLADKDKLVFSKSPDEIVKLFDALQKAGVQVYLVPPPKNLLE